MTDTEASDPHLQAPPVRGDGPTGDLCIRTLAMPADTNQNGDIFGGWLLSQMDVGGGIFASKVAKSRTVTVAIEAMNFRKPVYVGDPTAMYSTEAAVPATADAIRNLFVAQGWVPYGTAGDTDNFKKNAILATVTVSSAPAQGGKTMIQYSNQLISSDIPAPQGVDDLRYVDEPPELTFATANKDAVVEFYRKALSATGWKSTMDKMVDVDGGPTMIFRNPAKEMITLSVPYDYGSGKLGVSVRYQSATEIADRRSSCAPKLSSFVIREGPPNGGEVWEREGFLASACEREDSVVDVLW